MRLGDLLIQKGILNEQQLRIALQEQNITGNLLGSILVTLGFVASREIAAILAQQSNLEFIDLTEYVIPEEALRAVPRDVAERAEFIPLQYENGVMSIGVTNPTNIRAVDIVTQLTGMPAKIFMVDTEGFYQALERAYYFLENPIPKKIEGIVNEARNVVEPQGNTIAELTDLLIMDGIRRHATDIHFRPMENSVHIFFRIDGVMSHIYCVPKNMQNGIISRIKIMAQLNIAETRLPQDGSFPFEFLSSIYDMRVSLVPTIFGENVVIRILHASSSVLRLNTLGFDEHDTRILRTQFAKPYGIILITGPTGSGKTTTLYSALREIDLLGKNVMTVEDPVEYRLSMVRQTQVNIKAGYDFALAGRNFMRQDPDVILLGEIRDEETAAISVRAAITGHLVLSTLHTNDAITAIPRLVDLGVDKFMLASSIRAIVAQRLLRKLCPYCKTQCEYPPGAFRDMELPELEGIVMAGYRGRGCTACNYSGYLGRTVAGEILVVDDPMREMIYQGGSLQMIRERAINNGMRLMREDALEKAAAGITSYEEIVRVIG
ncbi:MAG: GspE/PulE family protein [Desulfobacterota bacterium]|nr:GspE/PulE family protein [Thermodesulfobacteriota bacterium]